MTPKFKVGDKLWYEHLVDGDKNIFVITNVSDTLYYYDVYSTSMELIRSTKYSIKSFIPYKHEIIRRFTKLDEVLL